MTDLVKRLRSFEYLSLEHICCEAADSIEELEDIITEHKNVMVLAYEDRTNLQSQIDELRKTIKNMLYGDTHD